MAETPLLGQPRLMTTTPPSWDCYYDLHSCHLVYNIAAPLDTVLETFKTRVLIKRVLADDGAKIYPLPEKKQEDSEPNTLRFARVSAGRGFRDIGT